MKNLKLVLPLLFLSLTACLQEPAPIINNYSKNNYNKTNYYRSNQSMEKNDKENTKNYIFPDEVQVDNAQSSSSDLSLDPYSAQERKHTNKNQNKFNIDKNEVNWNNLFSEPDSDNKKTYAKKKTDPIIDKTELAQRKNQDAIKKENIESKNKKEATKTVKKNVEKQIPIEKLKIHSPVNGEIITKFGNVSENDSSEGVTYRTNDTKIFCAGDGKVIYTDNNPDTSNKTIIIKDNNGVVSSYSFNGNITIDSNDSVKAGQEIGQTSSSRSIVYFTTRYKGKLIDPLSLINK